MNTTFNPKRYAKKTVCKTTGKTSYDIELKVQKHWFKLENPQGRIQSTAVQIDENVAVVESQVFLDSTSTEPVTKNTITVQKAKFGERYVQAAQFYAETSALFAAGYGFDENGERIVIETPAVEIEEPQQQNETLVQSEETSVTEQVSEPVVVAEEPPQPPPSRFTQDMPVEDILASMTLDEAKAVIVDIGTCKGWTLAEVLAQRPVSLNWYTTGYSGDNNLLRAGAKILLDSAISPEQQAA